ncbi:MAG: hypothetical protein AAGM22_08980 [Acidobacteriota bacterium]
MTPHAFGSTTGLGTGVHVSRGAAELSELRLTSHLLKQPRLRLRALIALTTAAKELGLSTDPLRSELRGCLDSILARRSADVLWEIAPQVRELLPQWLGSRPADRVQDLAATLSAPRRRSQHLFARSLLAGGDVARARAFAKNWREPSRRHHIRRLVRLGLEGTGSTLKFVAPPFDESFPTSLPRYLAMAEGFGRSATDVEDRWSQAEAVLAQLGRVDRQTALAHRAAAVYRTRGYANAAGAVRSIRHRSERQLAWLRILLSSVEAGRLDDAYRALGTIGRGAQHERGRLLIARELIRKGQCRQARRLLSAPFQDARREEKLILLAELDLEIFRRYRPPRRHSRPRAHDDLATWLPGTPTLEQRWTALGLRYALEKPRGVGDGPATFDALGLWPERLSRLVCGRDASRAWLRDLDRRGVDPAAAVPLIQRIEPRAVEPMWCEWLSLRARRIGKTSGPQIPGRLSQAFIRGLAAGGANPTAPVRSEAFQDPLSAERSFFDEGLSWSPHAKPRRRVLLTAIKHVLKAWLLDGVPAERRVVHSRLRTLSNLGGSLAIDRLARVLEAAVQPTDVFGEALAVLTSLAPRRAARLLFQSQLTLLFNPAPPIVSALRQLEAHRVLDAGFTDLWCRFVDRLRRHFTHSDGERWLEQWLEAQPGAPGGVPSAGAIRCCLGEIASGMPSTGGRAVHHSRRRLDSILDGPLDRLPTALLRDSMALPRLHWLHPRRTAATRPARADADLRRALMRLKGGQQVDEPCLWRLVDRLVPEGRVRGARARALFQRLLAGRHPAAEAFRTVELPPGDAGGRHRLVHLDKRRDVLTFLNFADCVNCCYNSSKTSYRIHDLGWWVLYLWKDPLSFCFHVERRESDGWRPRGFVFGGFGLGHDGLPAVLLNGLYLRRQTEALRSALLAALEETLCRPLGIRRLALANAHGGRGPLPPEYVQRSWRGSRLRALRYRALVTRADDDISTVVNRPVHLSHLYWRTLPPEPRPHTGRGAADPTPPAPAVSK